MIKGLDAYLTTEPEGPEPSPLDDFIREALACAGFPGEDKDDGVAYLISDLISRWDQHCEGILERQQMGEKIWAWEEQLLDVWNRCQRMAKDLTKLDKSRSRLDRYMAKSYEEWVTQIFKTMGLTQYTVVFQDPPDEEFPKLTIMEGEEVTKFHISCFIGHGPNQFRPVLDERQFGGERFILGAMCPTLQIATTKLVGWIKEGR